MCLKLTHCFAATLLALTIGVPSWGEPLHKCGMAANVNATAAHHHEAKSTRPQVQKSSDSSHSKDCHCPSHGLCGHQSVSFCHLSTQSALAIDLSDEEFLESRLIIRPEPFLERPFQPPRA